MTPFGRAICKNGSMTNRPKIGPMLRLVLGVGYVLAPLAQPLLKRRLKRGKEDPDRWREKLGYATLPRPDGTLIWLHGVGVGEVMALRGLIENIAAQRPDVTFLVTSSARSSGEVFAKNLPANTCHQYLPLDLPAGVTRFLDHWQPDLAIWSDQEIWPRMAVQVARRGIPQAYVAARITDHSAKAKAQFGSAYGDLFGLFNQRHAQDAGTAAHLRDLMGDETPVHITGSLKAAAAPLRDDPVLRSRFETLTRPIWVAASAHHADITLALETQSFMLADTDARNLLIIAPRNLDDAAKIKETCETLGLTYSQRSAEQMPSDETDVFIADTFGELGVWYRLAFLALIGGTLDGTQGHNPWEAVALGCPVVHGPYVANFALDFAALDAADAACSIGFADGAGPRFAIGGLVKTLTAPDLPEVAARASLVREQSMQGVQKITADLLALLDA